MCFEPSRPFPAEWSSRKRRRGEFLRCRAASIIIDGPFCIWQGAGLGNKCFRNFAGSNAGPQTMRWGVEQSRNLMTVRTANQIGMDKVTRRAHDLGVGDYPNYLAIALGAGETTPMRITNAVAILANSGRAVKP